MSTWDDRWGPIIAERKARQDAGLAARVQRIDEGLRAREEKFRPNYMAILPEPSGSLRQGGGSVAAINVNFDPKIDTISGDLPPNSARLLPIGSLGDTLYHDGDAWVVLAAPTGMTRNPALRFDLGSSAPFWEEPDADCAGS